MRLIATLLLSLLTALPASAQVAPTEAELRAYGGLHAAAARGDVADIERRVAAAENKEALDARQRTPLHVAVYQKQHDAARALIRLGADPNKLEALPKTGPLVIVANHPFGLIDGLLIAHLANRVRRDFKVLTNSRLDPPYASFWVSPLIIKDTAAFTSSNNHYF